MSVHHCKREKLTILVLAIRIRAFFSLYFITLYSGCYQCQALTASTKALHALQVCAAARQP